MKLLAEILVWGLIAFCALLWAVWVKVELSTRFRLSSRRKRT